MDQADICQRYQTINIHYFPSDDSQVRENRERIFLLEAPNSLPKIKSILYPINLFAKKYFDNLLNLW